MLTCQRIRVLHGILEAHVDGYDGKKTRSSSYLIHKDVTHLLGGMFSTTTSFFLMPFISLLGLGFCAKPLKI